MIDLPKIPSIPKFPKLLKQTSAVEVKRGVSENEIVIISPFAHIFSGPTFEHDFTWDCDDTIYFLSWQCIDPPSYVNFICTLVSVKIHNRSGADDIFKWYLYNATTDDVLYDMDGYSLPNKAIGTWALNVGRDRLKEGDLLYVVVYDGILGTTTNEPHFGELSLNCVPCSDSRTVAEWMGVELS